METRWLREDCLTREIWRGVTFSVSAQKCIRCYLKGGRIYFHPQSLHPVSLGLRQPSVSWRTHVTQKTCSPYWSWKVNETRPDQGLQSTTRAHSQCPEFCCLASLQEGPWEDSIIQTATVATLHPDVSLLFLQTALCLFTRCDSWPVTFPSCGV